jgi:hypothetical protein
VNQNIFLFVQENQLTNYSKERGDRIFVTPAMVIGLLANIEKHEINHAWTFSTLTSVNMQLI